MSSIYPNIPKYHIDPIDQQKVNVVQYWGFFSREDLNNSKNQLLMLDIDFGRKCSLRCPSCFRKRHTIDDDNHSDLTYEELLDVIIEAAKIGLKQVKICGAGEPFENTMLLPFIRELSKRDIGTSIFTKAHVLGDDNLVKKMFSGFGISSGLQLCDELFRLKTSILVSLQSSNPTIQDQLVGGFNGFTLRRNRGLELLAAAGFNKEYPTRLAICANPIVKQNYNELFDIYVYVRERNILPINAAMMISGKQIDCDFLYQHDVSEMEKQHLFLRIYQYNLSKGYSTIKQLQNEGISCMPGIHPCNQIAAGLYLTCNGGVLRCPGDSGESLGNVHEKSIIDIWREARNWKLNGKFNCHCPFKDGITLPSGLYDWVGRKLDIETEIIQQ